MDIVEKDRWDSVSNLFYDFVIQRMPILFTYMHIDSARSSDK